MTDNKDAISGVYLYMLYFSLIAVYMYTSPCIMRIQGSLHVDYDRHSSFKNEESDIEVDLHHLNRSCHMFQDYWK